MIHELESGIQIFRNENGTFLILSDDLRKSIQDETLIEEIEKEIGVMVC